MVFIPMHHPPHSPGLFWVFVGMAAVLAVVTFLSWLRWQSEGLAPSQDSDSARET